MKQIKILLVEDDEFASEMISEYLGENGFSVDTAFTATDGVAYAKNTHYNIMILDINLPDFTGFEVLKSINKRISTPVIITSAYSDTKSKLLAFKYGASDYMVKPLDLEELEARIWLQLEKRSEIQIEKKKILFRISDNNIFYKENLLDLTSTEFQILSELIDNKNLTLTREKLVASLSSLSSNRSLDNHIKNIRKKIDDNGNKPTVLKTEYGIGYKLIF